MSEESKQLEVFKPQVAVCKHCGEQVFVAMYDVDGGVKHWQHTNSQSKNCASRNGRVLKTEAEPIRETIANLDNAVTANAETESPSATALAARLDGLTALLSTIRSLFRWLHAITRQYLSRRAVAHAVIASDAKCPACGIFAEHEMKFDTLSGRVIHRCARCIAVWSELPIVKFGDWRVSFEFEQPDTTTVTGDKTNVLRVGRAPTVIPIERTS